MDRQYSSESSDSDYESLPRRCGPSTSTDSFDLPYDYNSIENIILSLTDQFDMKVVYGSEHIQKSMAMTAGLAIAGTVVGKYFGGKLGAAAGGSIGGLCGLGVSFVHLRNIWNDVKPKLMDIYDLVYDYLAGLGISDYSKALPILCSRKKELFELVNIIASSVSSVLGRNVMSSVNDRMPSPRSAMKHARKYHNRSF